MLLTIQVFSQTETETNQYSEKEIEMILDTNYIFFVYNDSVYSQKGSFSFTGMKNVAHNLRYESNLSPKDANNTFVYMMDWWDYDPEYNKELPNMNKLSKATIDKLSKNKNFIKAINALKTMRYEIQTGKNPKSDFKQAALIVGIPEKKVDKFNPNSENFDIFSTFLSIADYDVIISETELQFALKRLQK